MAVFLLAVYLNFDLLGFYGIYHIGAQSVSFFGGIQKSAQFICSFISRPDRPGASRSPDSWNYAPLRVVVQEATVFVSSLWNVRTIPPRLCGPKSKVLPGTSKGYFAIHRTTSDPVEKRSCA